MKMKLNYGLHIINHLTAFRNLEVKEKQSHYRSGQALRVPGG
jgi:hypothetical protein